MDDTVVIATVPAEPGRPCSWCDCPLPAPIQGPGGVTLFAGHDEAACPGCDRGAVIEVQLYSAPLDLMVRFPACRVHRRSVEADMTAQFEGLSDGR